MGPPAILATNALTVCAEDKNAAVRRSCKRALAAVSADPEKPQSRGVEPTVEPLAETPDSEKNEPDKTAEVFPRRAIEVAKLDLPLVGRAAELALRRAAKRKLEKEEPEKIRAWRGEITYLSGVLDGDRRENREAAVEVLRYLSAYLDEALPGLRKALNDEDSGIQSRAAFALGEARDSDSVSNLGALLEKPAVKDYAVRALQAIGTAEAQKALKKAKIKPPNDAVLTASISARGRPDLSARELSDFCRQSTFELGAPAPKLNEYIEACIEASASFY